MQPYSNVYILPKLNAPDSSAVVGIIARISQAIKDTDVPIVDRDKLNETSLIIAVGGDGTMLEAMRIASAFECYAFGINMGNVGFLTEMSARSVDALAFHQDVMNLVRGLHQRVEPRTTITAWMKWEGGSNGYLGQAVNEVSISQMYADAMVTYRLSIDRVDAGVHKANSLLISTATGSTAYALAAGGVLMTPEMDALQIVPVAPTRLTSRPIITSAEDIVVHVWGDGIAIRTDGQVAHRAETKFTEDDPCVVRILKYKPAKVVHFDGWNFFNVLHEKLGWIK